MTRPPAVTGQHATQLPSRARTRMQAKPVAICTRGEALSKHTREVGRRNTNAIVAYPKRQEGLFLLASNPHLTPIFTCGYDRLNGIRHQVDQNL